MNATALLRIHRAIGAWGFIFAVGCGWLHASPPSLTIGLPTVDNAPVRIELDFPFSEGSTGGHFPVEVIIRNGSGKDATWEFETVVSTTSHRSESLELTTAHRMTVPRGKTVRFPVSVAVPDESTFDRHSVYFNAAVKGPYTSARTRYSFSLLPYRSRGGDRLAYLLSPGIDKLAGRELRQANNRFGTEHLIGTYSNERMPTDWRCFVGYDKILTTREDWLELDPAQRDAVLDAVATGRVGLGFHAPNFSAETARELDLDESSRFKLHGFGIIGRYGEPLNDAAFTGSARDVFGSGGLFDPDMDIGVKRPAAGIPEIAGRSDAEDRIVPLERRVRERRPPVTLISIGILGFGLLVGPINLFALAAGRKRMRLFVTTPLLALGATGLLVVGIFLADGVGGEGYVSRLIYLKSDTNEAMVQQTQYSTSGLLFQNAFTVPEKSLVEYRGASVSNVRNLQAYGSFGLRDGVYSGDWFGSKRLQGQDLTSYLPTRESIQEIGNEAGEAPVLFSNFRGACERLYYVDSEGKVWQGKGLKLGARQTLEPADRSEFAAWFARQKELAGNLMATVGERLEPRRGHVYAEVGRWEQEGLELLGSIDWDMHSQLLVAEVAGAGSKGER